MIHIDYFSSLVQVVPGVRLSSSVRCTWHVSVSAHKTARCMISLQRKGCLFISQGHTRGGVPAPVSRHVSPPCSLVSCSCGGSCRCSVPIAEKVRFSDPFASLPRQRRNRGLLACTKHATMHWVTGSLPSNIPAWRREVEIPALLRTKKKSTLQRSTRSTAAPALDIETQAPT